MNTLDEQLIALGAVFEAATLVDRIARTGQVPNASLGCMLGSLLARNPETTLEIYGGDDLNLRDGYRALVGALERDSSALQREPLRYALAMIGLERQREDARPSFVPVTSSKYLDGHAPLWDSTFFPRGAMYMLKRIRGVR